VVLPRLNCPALQLVHVVVGARQLHSLVFIPRAITEQVLRLVERGTH
jgi:hypothetical protein